MDRRARDRAMPEPSLIRSGILPLVGRRIAAGMAQRVRMSLQREAGMKAVFDTLAARPVYLEGGRLAATPKSAELGQ